MRKLYDILIGSPIVLMLGLIVVTFYFGFYMGKGGRRIEMGRSAINAMNVLEENKRLLNFVNTTRANIIKTGFKKSLTDYFNNINVDGISWNLPAPEPVPTNGSKDTTGVK